MERNEKAYTTLTNQDFYRQLAKLYAGLGIHSAFDGEIDADELAKCLREGTAVISCYPPTINYAGFSEILEQVKELFLTFQPEDKDFIMPLLQETLQEGESRLKEKLLRLFAGEPVQKVFGLDSDDRQVLTMAMLSYTLKPFLKAYGKYIAGEFSLDQWTQGYCPVCGHSAGLSRLAKDEHGKRYLWCPICEVQWKFKRVGCPSCLEERPEKLGYFRVEGEDDGYRINLCHTCNSYLKTYDESNRQKNNMDIFIEEKKTSHLDYLAQKQGYFPIG